MKGSKVQVVLKDKVYPDNEIVMDGKIIFYVPDKLITVDCGEYGLYKFDGDLQPVDGKNVKLRFRADWQ